MSGCEQHPGRECCPCHHDHADCLDQLREAFTRQHLDVTVSTVPPIVRGPFTLVSPFICPHGVRHWAEPTGEQLAAWNADGEP